MADYRTLEEINRDIMSKRRKKVIMDTDTFNEEDDQYAVAYAMLSDEYLDVISMNAAPFHNDKSSSFEEGMEKSFNELTKIAKLTNPDHKIPIFKGSRKRMPDKHTPVESPAAENIITSALDSTERIYVIAIGAITNVASAILMCPEIKDKIAVIWLGGTAMTRPQGMEFNFGQDINAAISVFESGVPLIQVPASGVTSELITSIPELEHYIGGKNELCDYLVSLVRKSCGGYFLCSKIIWDIAGVACLTLPESTERIIINTPRFTDNGIWYTDISTPPMLYVQKIHRDMVYEQLYKKLAAK